MEDNSDNETGFKIERRNGSYSESAPWEQMSLLIRITILPPNTVYFYRVRAYNSIGNSAYCAEVNAVTSFLGAPSKLVAETISGSQINLSWTDNAGNETGFKIERRTSKGSYKQIATVRKNKTSIPIKGLLIIQLTITGSGLTIPQQIRHIPMNRQLLPDLFLQHRQILRRRLYPVRESALHGKTTPEMRPV